MLRKIVSRFSILHPNQLSKDMIKTVRECPPEKEYAGFAPKIITHKENQNKLIIDKTHNLSFLLETSSFPACTDLGICINLGTRDEEPNTAGSLEYLKNFVHIKPTLEQTLKYYDFYQQSGATFGFDFDHQYTYVKCSFFSEDVDIMSDLLLDLALKDKKMYEEGVDMISDSKEINDLVRQTAFGFRGLGMPRSGLGNKLTSPDFLNFQQKITPHNTIFSIAGYPDQQKLVKVLTQKITKNHPEFLRRKVAPRTPSPYVGGYKKYAIQDPEMFEFAIAFQSCPFNSPNMEMMNILRVLLGSASSFSSGGPGKGMHSRCTVNLLNSVRCVEKASFINQHYHETGLFGLTVGGPFHEHKEVVECTIAELKKLRNSISNDELERSKNILVQGIYTNIERQSDRLEEMSKHIFSYGRVRLFEFEGKIRSVTSQQIKAYLTSILSRKPTIVCVGDEESLKKCYGADQVMRMLR